MATMDDFNVRGTAPVVGQHKKSKSLAAFDPLALNGSQGFPPRAGGKNTPSTVEEDREHLPKQVSQKDLYNELRAIASELGKQSNSLTSPNELQPHVPDSIHDSPIKEEEEETKTAPRTPLQGHRRMGSRRINSTNASPAQSPGKGLWGVLGGGGGGRAPAKKESRHTRTRSMPVSFTSGGGGGVKKTPPRNTGKKTLQAHSRVSSRASLSSDMLRELWDLQEQTEGSALPALSGTELSIPSLAKPRPTSFLTGKEVVLSSEADATEWQLDIPVKTEFTYTCRASSFLESYRTEKGVLDLNNLIGCSSADLAMFAGGVHGPNTNKLGENHIPIVESLLECGTDLVEVQGYLRSGPVGGDPSCFREILMLERQRQFLCVFRGTMQEQQGKFEKQPDTIKLFDNKNVTVFADRYKALQELEPALFGKLDQLMEDNPFCDFVFAGHGFGGAMATLAAYRYSWARPELRVAALVTGSTKVGLADFRLSANSLPNLKVVRVYLGQAATGGPRSNSNAGVHVGHTIRINPGKLNAQITAFKFATDSGDPKVNHTPMRKLRFSNNREKSVSDYVDALDDLGETWVKDFYREDGAGVKGKDGEGRLVV